MGKRETSGGKRQRVPSNGPAAEWNQPAPCSGAASASTSVRAALSWSLSSKFLCFGLRTLIARRYGPRTIAFSDAYLGLLFAIALWPAREIVRRVILQRPELADRRHWLWCNILWCIGTVAVFIHYIKGGASMLSFHRSKIAYILVGAGATIEASIGEWLHLRYLLYGDAPALAGRARADGLAALAQNIVALWFTRITGDDAIGMALGWFTESVMSVAMLSWSWRACSQRLPRLKKNRSSSQKGGPTSWRLWVHASLQAMLKFFASDAENMFFVMSNRLSMEQIGAYKLAGNLASLVLRYFFLPLEESVYIVSARLQNKEGSSSLRGALAFTSQVRLCALLAAILLACVGPAYVPVFLQVLYGTRWLEIGSPRQSPAVRLLTWYLRALIAPALLGTTEAFAVTAILPRLPSRMLVVHASISALISVMFVFGARWAVVVAADPLFLIANHALTMLLRAGLAAATISVALRADTHLNKNRSRYMLWPNQHVWFITALWAVTGHYLVSWIVARKLDILASCALLLGTLVQSLVWVWVVWRAHGPVIRQVLWRQQRRSSSVVSTK